MKNERIRPEEILKEAKSYFDKLNLNSGLDSLFENEAVKNLIHTTYEKYEEGIRGFVQDMPEEIRKRGEELLPQATGREEDFFADVKNNLMCNMVRVIKLMEDFVPVDEAVSNVFIRGFRDEADGKMFEMVKHFTEGLAGSLLHDFIILTSVPSDLPPEVAAIVAMIGGEGAIALNGDEMMEMLKHMEEDLSEDEDEEIN